MSEQIDMLKTLQRPDEKVNALLGKNKGIKAGDPVRPSQFAVIFDYGTMRVLYNTMTCQCLEIDEALEAFVPIIEAKDEVAYDPDDAMMAALVQADFLVASHIDEAERYGKILSLVRKMDRKKTGYTTYTILPTTACNARCVYCYEAGIPYETMDEEMTEKVVQYIHATRRKDAPVSLRWFGGEPLLGEKIIDAICAAMRRDEIEYSSTMISNGSLFTEECIRKAVEDWHLKTIQITLDGREDVYCARKRYVAFDGSPYRAVLNAIHALLHEKVRVNIRLNVDEENMEEMHTLVDELFEEFPEEKGITVYCNGLFVDAKEDTDKDVAPFYDALDRLNERLYTFKRGREEVKKESQGRMKRHYCMADDPFGGPVIMPNGELYICEHIGQIPVAGHVEDGMLIDREALLTRNRLCDLRCRSCSLLPVCTDCDSCPVRKKDCYRENRAAARRRLEWVMTSTSNSETAIKKIL